jgi:uncharacterized protein YjaZ
MLAQEGLAAVFGGLKPLSMADDELAYTWQVLQPYLDSDDFPASFACVYGDAAAYAVGYPTLGLSERAGYTIGYHLAQSYMQRTGESSLGAMTVSADEIIAL